MGKPARILKGQQLSIANTFAYIKEVQATLKS
ncbi:hypothetical protein PARA125_000305 [Parachlamydia sp. AcF125]|nr:hypothetical protein [Parachlamydia sp. AcF125]